MAQIIEETSTITSKGQTTVPKAVRKALGVESGDRVVFRVGDGGVTLHRVGEEDRDPVIESFLAFLAKDIEDRPHALRFVPQTLMQRAKELTDGSDIDLDEAIEGDVDL